MNSQQQPYRVLYMGTPEFAVPSLSALCRDGEKLGVEVVAVATQPDRPAGRKRKLTPGPVKQAALDHDIPVYQPERLRNNPQAVEMLAETAPDLVVVAAYGLILPKAVLDIPRFGCVNVHASLLPAYRGASPITAALLDGLDETGVSIMLMDEGMDTGPVLVQAKTPIHAHDTTATLTARLAQLGATLLTDTLVDFLQGAIEPTPQDQLPGTPSLCGRIQKTHGRIDWSQPAAVIERMVRAYTPWPSAYTFWQRQPFKILQAQVIERPQTGTDETGSGAMTPLSPGVVAQIDSSTGKRTVVGTGDGLLELARVQPAGKRAMDIASFLNGASDFIGARLEQNESA